MQNQRNLADGRVARKARSWLVATLAAIAVSVALDTQAVAQDEGVYDAWTYDCQDGSSCIVYFATAGMQAYLGDDVNSDRKLLEFRLPPSSVPQTPVAILLDNNWLASLEVLECDGDRCRMIIDVSADPSIVENFKQASSGTMAYVINDGADLVIIPFTLDGFTATYNQLGW